MCTGIINFLHRKNAKQLEKKNGNKKFEQFAVFCCISAGVP